LHAAIFIVRARERERVILCAYCDRRSLPPPQGVLLFDMFLFQKAGGREKEGRERKKEGKDEECSWHIHPQ